MTYVDPLYSSRYFPNQVPTTVQNTLYSPQASPQASGSVLDSLRPTLEQAAAQGASEAVNALARPMVGTMPILPNDNGGAYMGSGMQWDQMGKEQLQDEYRASLATKDLFSMNPRDWPESNTGKVMAGLKSGATSLMGPVGPIFNAAAGAVNERARNEIPRIGNAIYGPSFGDPFRDIPGTPFYDNPFAGTTWGGAEESLSLNTPPASTTSAADYQPYEAGGEVAFDWGGGYQDTYSDDDSNDFGGDDSWF